MCRLNKFISTKLVLSMRLLTSLGLVSAFTFWASSSSRARRSMWAEVQQKWLRVFCRWRRRPRSEVHTSELQSHSNLVCRLLPEKKNQQIAPQHPQQQLQTPAESHS